MADNLCGPSNPTKGLVGHLDRNRNVQQDHVVTSSQAASAGTSFHTASQASQAAAATADFSFTAFTAGHPHPSGQMMQPSPAPAFPAAHTPYPYPGSNATSSSRATHGTPNTSWVADFQRMQLGTHQGNGQASVVGNAIPSHAVHNPHHQIRQGVYSGSHVPSTWPEVGLSLVRSGRADQMTPEQLHSFNIARATAFMSYAPDDALRTSPPQSKHYPQELALANTTEEALESAFAEYDADFQNEMDQWMGTHQPSGREEAFNESVMREFEWVQNYNRANYEPGFVPQDDPRAVRAQKKKEDYELQKAALETLQAFGDDAEKSPELREKVAKSSFVDLLKRIANGEVVRQGQDFFDNVAGKVIDARDESASGSEPTLDPEAGVKIINVTDQMNARIEAALEAQGIHLGTGVATSMGMDMNKNKDKGKGKGKEKEKENAAQHVQGSEGSGTA